MAANQTRETDASVGDFLNGVPDPKRRADAHALLHLMHRATGVEARMWGPAIIGFGKYRYRYDSGREGEMLRVGFSPRKANLALYLIEKDEQYEEMLGRLGKHKRGGSCLYINKLEDVDLDVLRQMVTRSWRLAADKYGPQE